MYNDDYKRVIQIPPQLKIRWNKCDSGPLPEYRSIFYLDGLEVRLPIEPVSLIGIISIVEEITDSSNRNNAYYRNNNNTNSKFFSTKEHYIYNIGEMLKFLYWIHSNKQSLFYIVNTHKFIDMVNMLEYGLFKHYGFSTTPTDYKFKYGFLPSLQTTPLGGVNIYTLKEYAFAKLRVKKPITICTD